MRNLREYPITLDEVKTAMEKAMADISYEKTGQIGSPGPVALKYAYDFLMDHSNFPIYLEMKQDKANQERAWNGQTVAS